MIRLEYQVVAEIRKEQKQPLFTPPDTHQKIIEGFEARHRHYLLKKISGRSIECESKEDKNGRGQNSEEAATVVQVRDDGGLAEIWGAGKEADGWRIPALTRTSTDKWFEHE